MNGYYGEREFEQNYLDCDCTPLYPFGYGLSYSEFEISDLSVSCKNIEYNALKNGNNVNVSVKVKNVSGRDGAEVVQLYIRDRVASMTRPLRELRGVKKVFVRAGETETADFEIDFRSLGFYGADKNSM